MSTIKKTGLVIFALALILIISYCDNEASGPVYLNHSDIAQYVGMQTCRSCHSKVYDTYIKTGMGHSFGLAKKERSDANFSSDIALIYDSVLNFYYKPYWDADTMKVMEFRLDGEDTIHKRTERISYIIGSGHHTNSHLIEEKGYLYQAPVTYYTQSGKWDLAPGFENGFSSRFERAIGTECITCHNGYPKHVEESMNKYNKIPLGIDCERCHGPGSIHVEKKRNGEYTDTSKYIDHSIVNPAKLSIDMQNSLCQRCHLQGVSVLNDDKGFFDFKPGEHLSKTMKVFMPEYEGSNKFIMASHVERLKKSECFIQSEAISCITCHNPHLSVSETPEEKFNMTCMACHKTETLEHEKADLNNGDCITCHMAKSGSVDIPHVAITDHKIQIPSDKVQAADEIFKGLRCISDDKVSKLELTKAYLAFYDKFQSKPQMLDSVKSLLKHKESNKSWMKVEIHYNFILKNWQGILNLATNSFNDPWTNYRIGQASYEQKNWTKAIEYFKKATQLKSRNLDFRNKLGSAYFQNMQYEKAQKEFQFILNENPKHSRAMCNLGHVFLLKGEKAKARYLFKKVITLNPDYDHAWGLLFKTLEKGTKEFETYERLLKQHKKSNIGK